MLRLIAIFLFSLGLAFPCLAQSLGESPQMDMVIKLKGIAARCAIDNSMMQLDGRNKDDGDTITDYIKQAHARVKAGKAEAKAVYSDAVALSPPEVRPALAVVYARWLDHMDALSEYFAEKKQQASIEKLTTAVNELMAVVDALPPTPSPEIQSSGQ